MNAIASRKFLVQSYARFKFWSVVMKFEILIKIEEICEIEKLTKLAQKINLRSVLDVKIHRGPALRAIFRFSAEPWVCSMGGGCESRWCMEFG